MRRAGYTAKMEGLKIFNFKAMALRLMYVGLSHIFFMFVSAMIVYYA